MNKKIENKSYDFANKNFTIEYIDTYKTEVTPERINVFKNKLAKIKTLPKKLAFCKNELKEYLQNLPAETVAASGNTKAPMPIFFDRIIIIEIEAIEAEMKLQDSNTFKLAAIFNDKNNAYEVCINLLDDLEIIIDGKVNMKDGRAGKLIGLISAIKETPAMLKLEKPSDKQLLSYFNSHLNTSYKTFGKRSEDYSNSKDEAERYIKNYFKK
jgi:hypothetical protein